MKLFLTSTGLPAETRDYFIRILPKKPSEMKVAFIPTAADPETDKWFVDASLNELKDIGFRVETVDLKENPEEIRRKFEATDIVYINGGNTFYLLDWVRKSGVDKYLGELVKQGKIYVGTSAGSILVGPNIESSAWGNYGDENVPGLSNLSGLGIVSFVVSPHHTKEIYKSFYEKSKSIDYPVIAIFDQQAVLVQDDKWQVVGVGKPEFFGKKL